MAGWGRVAPFEASIYRKEDGTWNGVIGDLVNGEIDIAVAGMTMTSEREEVVDFVAPYFDQSGISIIIRRPVRPRSLFKFMEVQNALPTLCDDL